MANHPRSPMRWAVRGTFMLAQGAIAVTVHLATDDHGSGAAGAAAIVTLVLMVLTLTGGIHLDVIRPHLARRQVRDAGSASASQGRPVRPRPVGARRRR